MPDKELVQSALDKIPDGVAQTVKLERIIKKGIVQYDIDYVLQSIGYTSQNIRDLSKFPAFLDKCIQGAWAEGWTEPEKVKPALEPVSNIDIQYGISLLESGKRKTFDNYVRLRGFCPKDISLCLEYERC